MYAFLCRVQKGDAGSAAASVSPILLVSEHILHFTPIRPPYFTFCLLFHSVFSFATIDPQCLFASCDSRLPANKAASHVKPRNQTSPPSKDAT